MKKVSKTNNILLLRKNPKRKISFGIVSFVLITSTILMPLSFLPKKAEAQLGTLGSISGYTSGLVPAIARLPQCRDVINSGIGSLFTGIESLFSSGETGEGLGDVSKFGGLGDMSKFGGLGDKSKLGITEDLDTKVGSATFKATTPAVSAVETERLLKLQNEKLERIAKSSEAINKNSSCIQSIGRLIVKMLLQKLTLSTVNWINSGFDGSPSFIQDPGKFFGDIAKNEVLQFGIEIKDINRYSIDWMRNNALAMQRKFADNARYSLNEMIASTTPNCGIDKKDGRPISCDVAFSQDFSIGGWDAWTAMTQVPANNPLGAKLMFDNEIQKRLAGTSQSVAQNTRDALQAASGFLGDQRCINAQTGRIDYDITRSEYETALEKTLPEKLCDSWEYVTPGKMISDYATQTIGYQNNSLLNVEDLNDAVAAVLDALLAQFSSNIMGKGFASLDYRGIDGVLVFSGTGSEPYRTQTEKDFMPSHLSNSWLQANPDFNIRTDLTQALIDEQRTYSDKLALQNKELISTTDGRDYSVDGSDWIVCGKENQTCSFPGTQQIRYGAQGKYLSKTATNNINCNNATFGDPIYGVEKTCAYNPTGNTSKTSNAYGLMPAIYQLDYCIPGPHPGWKDDSRQTLRKIILPQEQNSSDQTGEIVNSVIGIGLQALDLVVPFVGTVLSSVFGALTGDTAAKKASTRARQFYTSQFNKLTGYEPQSVYGLGLNQEDFNMTTNDGFFYVMDSILDRYIKIINKTYFSSPDMLPTVAKEAEREFNQLPGYNQIIKDNKNKMLPIKTTVSILGDIKNEIDALNEKYRPFDINTSEEDKVNYENELKAQINAFGRLSASMVNGDDIAAADDLVKQIVLKKDYIYKNLLKGPYGCEADLERQQKNFPSAGITANGTKGVAQPTNDWSNYNVNSIKRMTYPFPILYDYNNFEKGKTLPDPWNSGYAADKLPKMPAKNEYENYGPGFLSFVYFSAVYDNSSGYNGSERLDLHNLVNDKCPGYEDCEHNHTQNGISSEYDWVSVGKSNVHPPRNDGFFEKTIGVY